MLRCDFRKLLAVALLLTTTLITMPVSAADFSTPKAVIGSVSAVGSVDLRGVGISQEGTLFSGDTIRANEKGYAKVLLGTGSKIELYEKTAVNVTRDAQGVKIAMNTGTIGVTAKSNVRVSVAPYEVTAADGSSAQVGVLSATTGSVKAINGKVTVRNTKTSESFVVLKGHEQLLGLQNGVHAPSLGEIAGNVPTVPRIPTNPPQTPAGKTGGGLAMDTGAWLAVLGAGALGAISIWALVEAHNNNNDVSNLNNTISNLNKTVTAQQAALKNLQAAQAAAANLSAQQASLNQALVQATAALASLTAAGQGNSSAAAALTSTISGINSSLAAITGLQASTNACIASGASGCGSQAIQNANNQNSTSNGNINSSNQGTNNAKQQCPSCNIQGGNVQQNPNANNPSVSVPL
jgi:hypothetical protein